MKFFYLFFTITEYHRNYNLSIEVLNLSKNALFSVHRNEQKNKNSPFLSKEIGMHNKKPRLFLTLVLSVLSEFHSHGEAACEEVVGVRLTFVWWRWR